MVKNKVIESKSTKYCKGGVFWASTCNTKNPHNAKSMKLNSIESAQGAKITMDKSVEHWPRDYQSNIESINDCHTHSKALSDGGKVNTGLVENSALNTSVQCIENARLKDDGPQLLFDIRNTEGDKFLNSIIFSDQSKVVEPVACISYDNWRVQTKDKFGFIPLTDPIMPNTDKISDITDADPIRVHKEVKKYNLPKYLVARIPVRSQLNITRWKVLLKDYWDQQLLQCLEFGFPLGFNRTCPLKHDKDNHKSAVEFPQDVSKYIEEEKSFGAIIGHFQKAPIENLHYSPFMTRHKPNSDTRRAILDLSWPGGESVNAGVEKDGYMGADFKLTFPTTDDLTQELVKIGKGAHIFKVDVSRAFRHLNVDPMDYDLLGVNWGDTYIDTRIPFGSRQFFQRTSDAVRHILRQRDVNVINYIDNFLGYGTPSVAKHSYDALLDVMTQLGITISDNKLVAPTTKAVCLGILIDTVKGTVAMPPEKLEDIRNMVQEWKDKKFCTKRQLQSLLGTLLYVHKCVKPARCFLNRMLGTLET